MLGTKADRVGGWENGREVFCGRRDKESVFYCTATMLSEIF